MLNAKGAILRSLNLETHELELGAACGLGEKYLSKGDKIYCEGRIKTRQWEGEDGSKRYTTEIHVIDMTFLSTRKELNTSEKQGPSGAAAQENTEPTTNGDSEDDLPF